MNKQQIILDALDDLSATVRSMQQRQPAVRYELGTTWAKVAAAKKALKELAPPQLPPLPKL